MEKVGAAVQVNSYCDVGMSCPAAMYSREGAGEEAMLLRSVKPIFDMTAH